MQSHVYMCVWGVQAKHQGVHGSQLRCTRTIVEIQHGLELGPIVTLTAFCNLQMEGEGVKDSLRCKMGSSGHSGIPKNKAPLSKTAPAFSTPLSMTRTPSSQARSETCHSKIAAVLYSMQK